MAYWILIIWLYSPGSKYPVQVGNYKTEAACRQVGDSAKLQTKEQHVNMVYACLPSNGALEQE
jgi:hypothetical protein